MKKYYKLFIFFNFFLVSKLLAERIRIMHHDTRNILIHSPKAFFFTLDTKYAEKLSKCAVEHYDPIMLSFGQSPLILVINKDDKEEKTYKLYYYLETNNDAYFFECDYKISGNQISDIKAKSFFNAKKMPKLFLGEQKTEIQTEKPDSK